MASASRDSMAVVSPLMPAALVTLVMAVLLSVWWSSWLRPCLEDEVHGGLGGDADAGEARVGQDGPDPGRAGLGAERRGARLGERGRRADQGRAGVEDPADGV